MSYNVYDKQGDVKELVENSDLGSANISTIADGTVKGAIDALNLASMKIFNTGESDKLIITNHPSLKWLVIFSAGIGWKGINGFEPCISIIRVGYSRTDLAYHNLPIGTTCNEVVGLRYIGNDLEITFKGTYTKGMYFVF